MAKIIDVQNSIFSEHKDSKTILGRWRTEMLMKEIKKDLKRLSVKLSMPKTLFLILSCNGNKKLPTHQTKSKDVYNWLISLHLQLSIQDYSAGRNIGLRSENTLFCSSCLRKIKLSFCKFSTFSIFPDCSLAFLDSFLERSCKM